MKREDEVIDCIARGGVKQPSINFFNRKTPVKILLVERQKFGRPRPNDFGREFFPSQVA